MPEILEQIEKDLVAAFKENRSAEVLILRLLKTGIKNAEIKKRPKKIIREDEIKVLRSEMKKHEDSIAMFARGGRKDLVDRETAELKVIKKYLPKEMDEEELKIVIEKAIAGKNFSSADFGLAMKEAMKEVAGRADGKRVSALLKVVLGG